MTNVSLIVLHLAVYIRPLMLRYPPVLIRVNRPLIPQTPVLMPPVVQTISLYTALCSRKMPWGHVSLNSSTPPPPAQSSSSAASSAKHRIISFLHRLPDSARPPPHFLLGALGVRRLPATARISAFGTEWLRRSGLACGNVPCRVRA